MGEARRCIEKFVFAIRLLFIGSLFKGLAEVCALYFWLVGFGYSFTAPQPCAGPTWFNFFALRPVVTTFIGFAVFAALLFGSSRQKFLTLARTTGNTHKEVVLQMTEP